MIPSTFILKVHQVPFYHFLNSLCGSLIIIFNEKMHLNFQPNHSKGMFGAQPVLQLQFLCICTTGVGREVISVIQEEKGLYVRFRKKNWIWLDKKGINILGGWGAKRNHSWTPGSYQNKELKLGESQHKETKILKNNDGYCIYLAS